MRGGLAAAFAMAFVGCGQVLPPIDEDRAVDAAAPRTADGGDVDSAVVGDGGGAPATCDDPGAPAIFTTDFEGAKATAPFGFDAIDAPGPGTSDISLASAAGVNGSNAVLVKIPGDDNAAGTSHNRWLRKSLAVRPTQSWRSLLLDFDVFLVADQRVYAALAGFFFTGSPRTGTSVWEHALSAQLAGSRLDEAPSGPENSGDPSLATNVVGAWHHAKVCLLHDDGATVVRRVIRVDDTLVDDRSHLDIAGAEAVELRAGAFYTDLQAGAIEVRFDDVVLRGR